MQTPDLFLIIFIVLGAVCRVNLVSVAASILLVVRMLHFNRYLPLLERRSLELGLLFLMISILVPLAMGKLSARDMAHTVFSVAGLLTIAGGVVATMMNAKGLALLQAYPSLLLCVVLGTVLGIVLFRGMPVGPLMAAALAAAALSVYGWFKG
ncbi:DUF441 domain-containing protein [Alicyclobacillus cycloheptanicus]|uniref:UPF0756 membrane protein J2S03_000278 n=1 Tax=Alicyclobacillus cycloheptanicus TaxID=1457 RepID=A0ABT9XDU6_9BACL|nr:DUF441 domain-containing protein [Alicyclobacillus cycloheptanicus]MDQ0188474.1 uncharacterized membrane protein (DUF441 family) [Alicyclobacillus cycloheptanicus]WDM01165.1 DUF441 domain-containing protein [Alicyclobacillus cycloheptanicus]